MGRVCWVDFLGSNVYSVDNITLGVILIEQRVSQRLSYVDNSRANVMNCSFPNFSLLSLVSDSSFKAETISDILPVIRQAGGEIEEVM